MKIIDKYKGAAMNILVTGGCGYIGSHAVRSLKRSGHNVVILDNLSFGHAEFAQGCDFYQGEISDRPLLGNIFEKHRIAAVMHFAALAYVGESVTDPAKYYQNNVVGTLRLLTTMRDHEVLNFVFSSTCATYGIPQELPIPEDHVQSPINPYGQTKLMVEKILVDFDRAYQLKSVCLRYFNAAGADPDGGIGEDHDPESHLIPLVLDVALGRRKDIKIFGTDYPTPDGTCMRDYIHVNDLAEAHGLALEQLVRTRNSTAYNLGNGVGFSVKEIINTAEKVTTKKISVVHGPRREGDPAQLTGNSKKATLELGWSPKFADLESIIETAWNWHQKRFGDGA